MFNNMTGVRKGMEALNINNVHGINNDTYIQCHGVSSQIVELANETTHSYC